MLGENALRVLGLDLAQLQSIAARNGPTFDQVNVPSIRTLKEGSCRSGFPTLAFPADARYRPVGLTFLLDERILKA